MPKVHDQRREALPLMRSLPDICGVPAVIWEDAFAASKGDAIWQCSTVLSLL